MSRRLYTIFQGAEGRFQIIFLFAKFNTRRVDSVSNTERNKNELKYALMRIVIIY